MIASEAAKLGATRLIGEYIPTKKNAMVRDHYPRLGFAPHNEVYCLDLRDFTPAETFIDVVEE